MDALAPFGITHIDIPLTPAKIWQAVHDAGTTTADAER
jgi:carbon-monoxide dehydrogenase large subunit